MVVALAKVDAAVDAVLYRPVIVKAFVKLPRWWQCDLARLSILLDDRWQTGYWGEWIVPGGPCDVCGRRAAIHVYGGHDADDAASLDEDRNRPDGASVLDDREVHTCGWCHLRGEIWTEEDLSRAMDEARADSVAWRWRWRVRA
jgi:hypothetical protein